MFGSLSDKIGRKPIILAGCLLAALTYFPLFKALTHDGQPGARRGARHGTGAGRRPIRRECSFQFNPTGTAKFTSSCDIAKAALAQRFGELRASSAPAPAQRRASRSAATPIAAPTPTSPRPRRRDRRGGLSGGDQPVDREGCRDPFAIFNEPACTLIVILTLLVIYVTMVYGPIAAMLVELFPTRIRYTSMSLPYHIGNGWFGGLLPATAFAIVAQTGNIYYGLWYPIVIAAATFVIGLLFVPETKDRDIYAGDSLKH